MLNHIELDCSIVSYIISYDNGYISTARRKPFAASGSI